MKITSKHFLSAFIAFSLIYLVSSCAESYTKVQKSTDINYKYKKAVEYYQKKKYFQALPIFEELIGLFKGRAEAEDLYFYYANAEYEQKNYIIAGYHFKRFTEIYPESKYAEQALYLWATAFNKQSNDFDLEQDNTAKAIEAYQYFINSYPSSPKVADCNKDIKKLRRKLELKSVSIADLYYRTENYRAAAMSYKLTLKEFPDIDESEKLQFMVVKAYNKFAIHSIPAKKPERYKEVIKEYGYFADRYAQSKYMEEATKYFEDAKFQVIKSSYQWANSVRYEEREKIYLETIRTWKTFGNEIKDPKLKAQAASIMEDANFQIVRTYYQLAQNSSGRDRIEKLETTIQRYQNFIDKFAGSKRAGEAERIYLSAINTLKKLKVNGQN